MLNRTWVNFFSDENSDGRTGTYITTHLGAPWYPQKMKSRNSVTVRVLFFRVQSCKSEVQSEIMSWTRTILEASSLFVYSQKCPTPFYPSPLSLSLSPPKKPKRPQLNQKAHSELCLVSLGFMDFFFSFSLAFRFHGEFGF